MKAIMYHYVRNSNPEFPYFRYLSVENFRKQLDYFKKNFGFMTYWDFMDLCENPMLIEKYKNKILLTFDDGFIDHYEFVLPELLKRDTFGLFFIPTGVYQRQKALDVHRIHYLIGKIESKKLYDITQDLIEDSMINENEREIFRSKTYTNQDNDFYTQEFKKLFNYYIKYEFREKMLDSIVAKFGNDREIFNNLYATIQNLQEMSRNNMIIGSHSVNHFVLSKLSDSMQQDEIMQSFNFIESNITMGGG